MIKGKWTSEEVAYLSQFGNTVSRAELARRLGRGSSSVGKFMRRKGMPVYTEKYRKWTRHEVAQLYVLVEKYTYREIAKKFKRTPHGVANKLKALSLRTRTEVFSLESAARSTGYHEYQLKRARRNLGQEWRLTVRGSKTGKMMRYTITRAQLESLCDYLRTEGSAQVLAA